ncbi:MAG: protein translocase subunit SecF [Candidatus Gastranaerophilaceae bacterium]|jgi:preprotein translocase subunit SecF
MNSPFLREKNIIDVIKYKWFFIILSAIFIIPGIIAMIYSTVIYPSHTPLRVGIDFTGGTMLQYGFLKDINKSDIDTIRKSLNIVGIENPVIQVETKSVLAKVEQTKTENQIKSIVSLRTRFLDSSKENNEVLKVNSVLKKDVGGFELMQVSAVGPTLGKELFKNAIFALLLAFAAIVIYLTVRFQMDYAFFALFALLHDALFVIGAFSILGLFFGTQIDSLFITAILTVVGFSVHDTIVVYDRIRENSRFLAKKASFNEIVNASVNQTLHRSINTSLTVFLTLCSLYLLGGETTKDFVLAMILGILVGTYSSIFVASVLLAMWRSRKNAPKYA